MVSRDARAILDQAGIEVVRAVYAKTLAVRVLPRDYADPVEFNSGTVQLGEVDKWLQQYTKGQSTKANTTRVLSIISICIAFASLCIAIAALITRH
jgi:hypothetical protein